jgi:type I restriction enzyme S subunit
MHANEHYNWKEVALGEVCKVQGGFAFRSEDFVDGLNGIPVIKIGNLQNRRVEIDEKTSRVPQNFINEASLQKFLLKEGDVLIAMIGATTGKLATYNANCSLPAFVNQPVGRLLPDPIKVHKKFIGFALQTSEFQKRISENILAAAQGNISPGKLESISFPLPPISEQKKIGDLLDLVQGAIEQQEHLLALTAEPKKTLLHQLFTKGLRGEPQKQTEIAPIPKSWKLISCDDICETITVGVVVRPASHYVESGIPAFRSFNVQEDRLVTNDLVYPGTSCVVPKEYNGSNCIDLVIARPKASLVRSGFLSRFFNSPAGRRQTLGSTHGLDQQHLNVSAVKRILVPIPTLEEQEEIDSALGTVQKKIGLITAKKETLNSLFRTLLHQLMTAQIRVHDLDLSAIEKQIAA